MSGFRQVDLPQAANFEPSIVRVGDGDDDEPWSLGPWADSSHQQPCTVLESGTVIQIGPMTREFGGWNPAHFHEKLALPEGSSIANGIVVTLEARARECVAVALSPEPDFSMGKTYAIHFGAASNVSTVVRRRLPSGHEAVDVMIPSFRICSSQYWISYWIALAGGKVYVGLGKQPGRECLGVLDDSLYHQLRSPVDAVRYVGLGNSVYHSREMHPLKIRNVVVTSVPEHLQTTLEHLPAELPPVDMSKHTMENDEETKRLQEEYQAECTKAKKRAAKFGIPYKDPTPQAFFQWSQARKLRMNPQKGFITGMDITSPEQVAKQEARAKRFGTKRSAQQDDDTGDAAMDDEREQQALPVHQAWDNQELVRPHRMDPPTSLWKVPPANEEAADDNFSMEPAQVPLPVSEKIHLCSIDWAAFKQIRTDDIMAYFASYGPSYIEWLGEISCNVLFEDQFSASRALQSMSTELPTPPPDELNNKAATTPEQGQDDADKTNDAAQQEQAALPDLGNMGWRLCKVPIQKRTNDRYGRRGTRARVLMRIATTADVLLERPTSHPKPPPGFTTKRVLGPGSDYGHRQKRRRRNDYNDDDEAMGENGEHPLLSRGLRSTRGGYTVEDLQTERASKEQSEGVVPSDAAAAAKEEG